MLSMETEQRVARLFNKLAEGEKSVEISKSVLSEKIDFDPYLSFKSLDREGKNFIDEFNIVDFLKY